MRSVPGVAARALLEGFAAVGHAVEPLRRAVRLPDDAALQAPDARVDEQALIAAWRLVVAADPRPELPTLVGLGVPFGSFGLVDYLAGSAPTIAEAMAAVIGATRLVSAGFAFELETLPDRIRVLTRIDIDEPNTEEYVLALLVGRLRKVAAHAIALRGIVLSRRRPRQRTAHATLLGCPVRFGGGHGAIELATPAWTTPIRNPDRRLQATLAAAAQALRPPDRASDLELTLRHHLRTRLAERPSVPSIARALGRSPRGLQRALAQRQLSLRDVLATERQRAATQLLADPDHAIADIALQLGYADHASFSRAFQRWTRLSPSAWRAQAAATPREPSAGAAEQRSVPRSWRR